jgi:tetratricopeptide (TPR) repeat protein
MTLISAFTPSLMSAAELEQIFVQREPLAQQLLDDIITSVTTPAKHFNLLIGARGMGKTHLLALVYYRLLAAGADTEGLADKMAIAWLREEERGVADWLDLVFRILRSLGEAESTAQLAAQQLQQMPVPDARSRATAILLEVLQGRTLVLLVENLDKLFGGLKKTGQQVLRSFLQEQGCCTILATTPAIFPAVQERSAPFFGFFYPIHLLGLTVAEAVEMVQKIATLRGQEDLARFLLTEDGRSRVRAVHHLAGGNARIYMLFSQFITKVEMDELVQSFMKMLDDLMPYYQGLVDSLPSQQQKIIDFLVDYEGRPMMVKEIAQGCFLEAGTAGGQLRYLRESCYVQAVADGRESRYELREVLMRLCLQVKKERGRWVEIFVQFLRIWVPLADRPAWLQELLGKSKLLTDEYLKLALNSQEDPVFMSCQRDLMAALQAKNSQEIQEVLAELLANQRLAKKEHSDLQKLLNAQEYSRLGQRMQEIFMGDSSDDQGQSSEQSEVAAKTLSFVIRGLSHLSKGKYEEVIADCDKALETNQNNDREWHERGFALSKLGRYEEAINSFDKALEINPRQDHIWHDRGFTLSNLGRYEEAITSCNKALKINPSRYITWHRKAMTQFVMGNYEIALESWREFFQVFQAQDNRPYDVVRIIQRFIDVLIPRFTIEPVPAMLDRLIALYREHHLLPELNAALTNTLGLLLPDTISDTTATAWLDLWHSRFSNEPELQIALQFMEVTVAYKKQPSRRHHLWLRLPQEQRPILDRILGLADF